MIICFLCIKLCMIYEHESEEIPSYFGLFSSPPVLVMPRCHLITYPCRSLLLPPQFAVLCVLISPARCLLLLLQGKSRRMQRCHGEKSFRVLSILSAIFSIRWQHCPPHTAGISPAGLPFLLYTRPSNVRRLLSYI